MNCVTRLQILVRSEKTREERSALLVSCHSPTSFKVIWQIANVTNKYAINISVLWTDDWVPISLKIEQLGKLGELIKYLEQFSPREAWKIVKHWVTRKEYNSTTKPENYIETRRWAPTIKQDPSHPAIKKIVTKLYSNWNAVLITPDSWVDNCLQEVYSSNRNKKLEDK